MKLQAAVIFTSPQNAKFTSIAGYTSCRPTYIENFMTIFGQCINVLNYNINRFIYIGFIVLCHLINVYNICEHAGRKVINNYSLKLR